MYVYWKYNSYNNIINKIIGNVQFELFITAKNVHRPFASSNHSGTRMVSSLTIWSSTSFWILCLLSILWRHRKGLFFDCCGVCWLVYWSRCDHLFHEHCDISLVEIEKIGHDWRNPFAGRSPETVSIQTSHFLVGSVYWYSMGNQGVWCFLRWQRRGFDSK